MSQFRTRVKICGITNAEDARSAVAAGADALGVVLAPSKRRVSVEQAAVALVDVPPPVGRIGVFVDADRPCVEDAIARIGLTAVQFHGGESPEECEGYAVPVLKAVRVGGPESRGVLAAATAKYRASVSALLVDTYDLAAMGGTGKAFDWTALGRLDGLQIPVFAAGGMSVENVAEAVSVLRPYAIDVSSGVESAPGRKDAVLMREFVAAVRAADLEVR